MYCRKKKIKKIKDIYKVQLKYNKAGISLFLIKVLKIIR
jgi:hypothetical protein